MDVIANWEPYAEYGKRILEKCAKKEVTGIMAAHSIPNLFYILRKDFSQEERRALLKDLCLEEAADYIVTRNLDDFIESRVKVIQPDELVSLF